MLNGKMKTLGYIGRIYNLMFHFCHRKDLRQWDYTPENHKKIYGVYHIYCVKDWKALVKEQISALTGSGLYEKTDVLYISCIISKEEDIDSIRDLVGREKCKIISKEYDGMKYEFPALEFIYDLSKKEDFLVYYFHTKGISRTIKNEKAKNNVEAWRKMMEYFNFYKYKVAINVLNDFDTYGACLKEYKTTTFYDGNFWWSKSSYIRTLPILSEENKKNRYWAEHWLCLKSTKRFSAFDARCGLDAVFLPDFVYRSDKKIKIVPLIRLFVNQNVDKFLWHLKLFTRRA